MKQLNQQLSELIELYNEEKDRKQRYREIYKNLFVSDYEFNRAWNEFLRQDVLESEARNFENLRDFVAQNLVKEVTK